MMTKHFEDPLPDFAVNPAQHQRNEALKKVTKNVGEQYKRRCSEILTTLAGKKLIGEEIRQAVEAQIGEPHHHNAWGGIIAGFVRAKRLVKTGHYRKMTTARSHARETPEYRVIR